MFGGRIAPDIKPKTLLYISPSMCSVQCDTALPHCSVISNLSTVCPCHLHVLQILCHRVIPGLCRSSRSSFAIFRKPCQCSTWYSSVIHSNS